MNGSIATPLLLAMAVGAAVPMQSAVNGRMALSQGHPLYGALTNTAVASLALALLILALPRPDLRAAAAGPWWAWTGGPVGAAFVSGGLFVASRIGATAFAAATVFGTIVASLAIDQFGLLGFPVQPASALRLAAVSCVLAGVLLLQASLA